MDNEIFIYTLGFLAARLSAVALFGYAIYLVLHGQHVAARSDSPRPLSLVSADSVADDRC